MAFADLKDSVLLAGVVTSTLLLIAYALLRDSLVPHRTEKPIMSAIPAMSPPRTDLAPPKNQLFTLNELKGYDGSTPGKPIYVSIKGQCASKRRKGLSRDRSRIGTQVPSSMSRRRKRCTDLARDITSSLGRMGARVWACPA
jgi:predicted heme/steroid binding protein